MLVSVAGSYPLQGLAGCIIVTIWPPELLIRTSRLRAEDHPQVRCVFRLSATQPAPSLSQSVTTEDLCSSRKSPSKLSPDSKLGPRCLRMESRRGTTASF